MARFRAGQGRSSRFVGSARRSTEWISATVNFTDFTASQSQNLLLLDRAILADLVPFTITRTVGIMVVSFDANFITNQTYSGAVGGCVVTDRASVTARFPF